MVILGGGEGLFERGTPVKLRDTSLIAAVDGGPPRRGNSTVSCHLFDLKVGTVDFASHSRGG